MTPKPRTEAEEIIHQLRRVHDGEPWHGPSRAEILSDVTAEEADWEPGAGAHGIWGQVLHMRSWTREVEARALGKIPDGSGIPVGGDWPERGDASADAWREAVTSLDTAHRDLVAVVRRLSPARLREFVGATAAQPSGTGVSVATTLWSLAEHDLYHAGQVSLLKRLARAALASEQ